MKKILFLGMLLIGLMGSAMAATISCAPSSIALGSSSTCTVSGIGDSEKNGKIEWRDAGAVLRHSSDKCSSAGTCVETYTPISAGTWTISYTKGGNPTTNIAVYACVDADSDGFYANTYGGVCGTVADCNDNNNAIKPGAVEVCDGIDNNCDGKTDDIATTPTSCGTGICASTGSLACVNGQMVDSCTPGNPETETCNGLDDNCDGSVDNGLTAPACPLQQGVCSGSVKTCGGVNGWLDCTAENYGTSYENPETTFDDALDNDCNGIMDDGNQIPEFGTVTALIALAGVGMIVYMKRRR